MRQDRGDERVALFLEAESSSAHSRRAKRQIELACVGQKRAPRSAESRLAGARSRAKATSPRAMGFSALSSMSISEATMRSIRSARIACLPASTRKALADFVHPHRPVGVEHDFHVRSSARCTARSDRARFETQSRGAPGFRRGEGDGGHGASFECGKGRDGVVVRRDIEFEKKLRGRSVMG